MKTLTKSVFIVVALTMAQLALAAKEESSIRLTSPVPTDELSFEFVNGDIKIESGPGNEIVVEATGKLETKSAKALISVDKASDDVEFKQEKDTSLKAVTVTVPASFAGELKVKTVSGTLQIQKIAAKEVSLETVSGALNGEIATPEFEAKSVSGTVNLKNTVPADVRVKTVSGNVTLALSPSEKYKVRMKSVSGSTENLLGGAKDAKKEVNVRTVSGNITIE